MSEKLKEEWYIHVNRRDVQGVVILKKKIQIVLVNVATVDIQNRRERVRDGLYNK